MVKLGLPDYGADVRRKGGNLEIYDVIRKKYIVLTPEEWVRQHMIHYLNRHCGYPLSLIRVEGGLRYNTRLKRSDMLVYNTFGKPSLLVECKSYKMESLSDEVLQQAAVYNRELNASWILITNGWGYYCWAVRPDGLEQVEDIPAWDEINRQG